MLYYSNMCILDFLLLKEEFEDIKGEIQRFWVFDYIALLDKDT